MLLFEKAFFLGCTWRPLSARSIFNIILTRRMLLLDMISEFQAAKSIKVAVRTLKNTIGSTMT